MIETTRFILPNGLRVVHNYDPSTAMAAVVTLYNVGARDERPEQTGIAHLFEHLMFGGSLNVKDFDGELQRAGGSSNAWTSNDFTMFYDVLPAQNIETALRIESDRMLQPALSEKAIDVQRHVVVEEFKQQCLNVPYGDRSHYLRKSAFIVHPYSWPVIGKVPEHIMGVTRDDAMRFFNTHYAPNNAVIAVSGNVRAERLAELIEKWYGDIPAREIAPRDYPAEPEQKETRYAEAFGNVPATMLTLAWKMDGYGTPEYYAADLLTDVMANGNASRFYRKVLMESELFTELDASILGSEEPGLLLINAKLNDISDEAVKRALEKINEQIVDLTENGITDYELQRVVNRLDSTMTFNNINYVAKAMSLARHELHNEDINKAMEPYRRICAADIKATARKIFSPERLTQLTYRCADGAN